MVGSVPAGVTRSPVTRPVRRSPGAGCGQTASQTPWASSRHSARNRPGSVTNGASMAFGGSVQGPWEAVKSGMMVSPAVDSTGSSGPAPPATAAGLVQSGDWPGGCGRTISRGTGWSAR